jgi:hypothetical protein
MPDFVARPDRRRGLCPFGSDPPILSAKQERKLPENRLGWSLVPAAKYEACFACPMAQHSSSQAGRRVPFLRQIAQIVAAQLLRLLTNHSGVIVASSFLARATTIFCIIAIKRF